ncbi:hypothetical protein IOCL2690_000119400 [Leishmania lindenbergi]|uniref:Uncharacterized protein n=1 Tax=Leishmania lindenbergi TaxID=651832 RepID=A0AAW3AWW1_9TRYP
MVRTRDAECVALGGDYEVHRTHETLAGIGSRHLAQVRDLEAIADGLLWPAEEFHGQRLLLIYLAVTGYDLWYASWLPAHTRRAMALAITPAQPARGADTHNSGGARLL